MGILPSELNLADDVPAIAGLRPLDDPELCLLLHCGRADVSAARAVEISCVLILDKQSASVPARRIRATIAVKRVLMAAGCMNRISRDNPRGRDEADSHEKGLHSLPGSKLAVRSVPTVSSKSALRSTTFCRPTTAILACDAGLSAAHNGGLRNPDEAVLPQPQRPPCGTSRPFAVCGPILLKPRN